MMHSQANIKFTATGVFLRYIIQPKFTRRNFDHDEKEIQEYRLQRR